MKTPWGEQIDTRCVLPEYPRPQMKRESYVNLNGLWDYAITQEEGKPDGWQGKILVPFSPECELSGVGKRLQPGEFLWYERSFTAPEGERVLLHFGAVDQVAKIFVNGIEVGSHAGGYTAFALDITDALQEANILTVQVQDFSDGNIYAVGKQRRKPGDIWYTPQSGIWQTVWLEAVPKQYIEDLLIIPGFDKRMVSITIQSEEDVECTVLFEGKKYGGRTNTPISILVPNFRPWSPEDPYLYPFEAILGEDSVESYFAMRKVEVLPDEKGNKRIFLNGKPYFMNGLLDQGYWSDGLYTAPSDEALIFDIQNMKDMGFNTLRKHIKVEPMRWYYHCDRLGMLVWQDMPNGGTEPYRFTTVSLPLVTGLHRKDSNYRIFSRADAAGRAQYEKELGELILQLRSVPSIVMWCPFNEGWGQFDAERVVDIILELDDTRLIDHASGWHDQGIGDFKSEHLYFVKYRYRRDRKGRCVILSEFGGYNYQVKDHCFTGGNRYRGYQTQEALLDAYKSLMEEQILPAKQQGLAACIYTQLSDVENEVNGLLTYDRKVIKLPTEAVRKINEKLL